MNWWMNQGQFWRVIEMGWWLSGGDRVRQVNVIGVHLRSFSEADIEEFELIYQAFIEGARRTRLWSVLEWLVERVRRDGGLVMGEETFEEWLAQRAQRDSGHEVDEETFNAFLGWLMAQGEETFRRVTFAPLSVAYLIDLPGRDWQLVEMNQIASVIYWVQTGNDLQTVVSHRPAYQLGGYEWLQSQANG